MKRVYLSGPMRGYQLWNVPAFKERTRVGRAIGLDIVSPAEMDIAAGFDPGSDPNIPPSRGFLAAAIQRDIAALVTCDAIALLPGWPRSAGVAAELAVAKLLGLEVLDAMTWGPYPLMTWEPYPLPISDTPYPEVGTVHAKPLRASPVPASLLPDQAPAPSICQEADRLVSLDRQDAYGHPADDFARIAAHWTAILGHPVTAEKVALCMIGVKLSRLTNHYKRDSIIDIAGYAKCLDMIIERRQGMTMTGTTDAVPPHSYFTIR